MRCRESLADQWLTCPGRRAPARPPKAEAERWRRPAARAARRLDDLDWYRPGDKYVITDELGVPVHPEWYSDEFARLLKRAGLRKIRLHDPGHATLSLMEKAGVPISIISKWAGHYDAAAFTMQAYVHLSDDDLKEGTRTLARLHEIA